MSWNERLKERWNVTSTFQVVIILLVFACTGTTVALIARPALRWIFSPVEVPVWATFAYYILILPIYNVVLLFYGMLFGQLKFFLAFEKKFFNRIFGKKSTP